MQPIPEFEGFVRISYMKTILLSLLYGSIEAFRSKTIAIKDTPHLIILVFTGIPVLLHSCECSIYHTQRIGAQSLNFDAMDFDIGFKLIEVILFSLFALTDNEKSDTFWMCIVCPSALPLTPVW